MILKAFFRALGQIGDPRFRGVLLLGLGLTLGLLVLAYLGFVGVIQVFVGPETVLPLIGEVRWLDDVLNVTSLLVVLLLSVFLMIPVASAITSMFLDRVADAVEAVHYPHLPPARGVSFADGLRDTLGFLGVLIAANLVALLVYLILSPAAPFLFYGLNGFLLGREYFTLAAMRRIGRPGARALRRRHAGTIWAAGILMALPLTVPVLNLLVPILGAATFTHLFHMLQDEGGRRG